MYADDTVLCAQANNKQPAAAKWTATLVHELKIFY